MSKAMRRAETKAAVEQARLLIEQAEALGEPPEDPLLLFSVLYGFWVANYVAFNGDVMRDLAAQFLALAEKQGATVPLMIGHRIMGVSLLFTGDIAEGRAHFDQAIALYDPAEHRPLATRFGQDVGVAILILSVVGSVVAWLSRGRARRRGPRAQGCARDRSSRHVDARADLAQRYPYPLRKLRGGKRASPMNLSLWRTKKVPRFGRRSE